MKYCYQCGRMTAGEPLFCSSCGRTYGVKLCPRLHANPRSADVCSQCGSRDLSTPEPRVSLWWKVAEFLVRVSLGALLALATVGLLLAMLRSPEVQNGLLVMAILVGLLWWLWSQLPDWFRKLVRRALKRKERGRER
jgi:RNA polymerase subunit RPABC4/transcription elongation factor Spt4